VLPTDFGRSIEPLEWLAGDKDLHYDGEGEIDSDLSPTLAIGS
jgi:hypothetical protein